MAKAKVSMNTTNPDDKLIVLNPKSLELAEVKVLDGEEEMAMEQLMLQSMVNI